MKPTSGTKSPILIVLLALSLPGTGCTGGQADVVIVGNYPPGADITNCAPPTAGNLATARLVPRGRFDAALAVGLEMGYMMTPAVINDMADSVDLIGFDIELSTDPDSPLAPAVPASMSGPTSNSVTVAGGRVTAGGGASVVTVEVLPATLATKIFDPEHPLHTLTPDKTLLPLGLQPSYPTINVRIRARVAQDGKNEVGDWLDYPVDVCIFCLGQRIGAPGIPAVDPTTGAADDCPADGADASMVVKTCLPQQDYPSSCCLSNGALRCSTNIPSKMTR